MVRWTTPGDPAERKENMAIMLQTERDVLVEKLAVAHAYLRFRAPRGGGYPKPAEIHAARQEIVSDPAYAKFCAPTESECTALLRQHGFTPPVVRRANQKKT
jgi:hypothetical protein